MSTGPEPDQPVEAEAASPDWANRIQTWLDTFPKVDEKVKDAE
jgi:hypothetical protein